MTTAPETSIRDLIDDLQVLPVRTADVAATDDLFDLGLTSLSLVTLLVALEEVLGVVLPDDLLQRESFRTIASIQATVGRASPTTP